MLDRSSHLFGSVFGALALLAVCATAAYGAPIVPTIDGPDIGFSAEMRYETRGKLPDILTTKDTSGQELLNKDEAGTYWPNYPALTPAIPLWYEEGGTRYYAADVRLAVEFTGSDTVAAPGFPSVSLTGTGAGVNASDLEIWGTTIMPGAPASNVLLWAVDLDDVSMYGYADDDTFVLEGIGTVVDGTLAVEKGVVGRTGVIRGHIDLSGTIGPDYDPIASDLYEEGAATYSAETGVPEPASLALLAAGGLVVLRRKRG
ncbi:MAG: PEP-CTERM sorting domain-containing protein [Planctomycetota bacterium]